MKFWLCIYFTNQPFRLFCNSVGFQFEKSIQVLKNQVWNFDVMQVFFRKMLGTWCGSVGTRFLRFGSLKRLKKNLCNVTLNNCMSLKKQTKVLALVSATEVLVLVWNEIPQLICQYSVVPYQQFKTVIAESTMFLHFHQVACSKSAGHLQPSLNKSRIRL